jgi:hypothetical protein
MPSILKRLPIPEHDDIAFVGTEHVRIKACEAIVWVSLTLKKSLTWDPATPCFPAILDIGHTHNFSIQDQHLIRWAGVRPDSLRILGQVRQAGKRLPRCAAHIWLHHNVGGTRDRLEDVPPHRLELPRGIAVYPSGEDDFPRLPLLGMRALLANKLHLIIDGKNQWANLRTQDWRTRLINWLL